MKIECSVIIDKEIDEVIKLWINPENNKHWQDGFKSIEHIDGPKGEVGGRSLIHYESKGRTMELEETIEVMNLPEEMTGFYFHKHTENRMSNYFSRTGDGGTEYRAVMEYTAFKGFMPQLLKLFGRKMFQKQTQKWLDQFKAFAESV